MGAGAGHAKFEEIEEFVGVGIDGWA